MVCCWPALSLAQPALVPDAEPQRVFAGEARRITVAWHNGGDQILEAEIRIRILQTSSAAAVSVGEARRSDDVIL